MKSHIKIIGALVLVSVGIFFHGCDPDEYLSVPAKGSLSEEVLANPDGVQALLIGAYGSLNGLRGGSAWESSPDNWIYGSVTGGDAHKGSDPTDQAPINTIQRFTADASLGFFNSKWRAMYEGISRTNAVLQLLQEIDTDQMSEQDQLNVAAQARFLRGHYYFELRKMFNRVPWVDENTEDPNQPNDREIWGDIEADFQFAFDNLPETHADRARANKWAAGSYLGKTYVYQEKWPEAIAILTDVITNGVTSEGVPYDLFDHPRDVWNPAREDGNPENIFYLQAVASDGTSGNIQHSNEGQMLNFPYNSPFRCCGFYQPTQDLVNSYRTEGGLPILDRDEYRAELVRNDMGIASNRPFNTYDGPLDPRLDWTVGRRGVPYHDWGPHPGQTWIRDQSYAGPYAPKKHVYWRSQEAEYANNNSWAPGTAINYPFIRFADVLLLAAEAEVEAGSSEQARQYVNRVRARAANESGWVNNDLNRAYASAIVDTEAEVTGLSGITAGDWVVVEEDNTTYVYLGGGVSSLSNWNRYEEPNYEIEEYSAADWAAIDPIQAVRFERKLELAMEGHRFFDLARWGIAEDELNSYFEWEGGSESGSHGGYLRGASFQSGKNEYFPIPQNQIDLSTVDGVPQLQQLDGYN